MSFTFMKNKKSGGLRGMCESASTVVKFNRRYCGLLQESRDHGWSFRLMVMKTEFDAPENCDWKWITFKPRWATETEGREWITRHAKAIPSGRTIRCAE